MIRTVKADDPLRAAFGHGDADNLRWQLDHPVVGERERALVKAAFEPCGARMLDVGAGDGATLVHLGDPRGSVGVELFPAKLQLARTRLSRAALLAGSAYALPFKDAAFDHVIVRDVIHHLDAPVGMLRECRRVLVHGGRLDVLEPCRYNPLIAFHALSQQVERGELKSTAAYLSGLLDQGGFRLEAVTRHQPLPLHRIVFHRKFGLPALGENAFARAVVGGLERAAGYVVPRFAWAYLHLRATKRGA